MEEQVNSKDLTADRLVKLGFPVPNVRIDQAFLADRLDFAVPEVRSACGFL